MLLIQEGDTAVAVDKCSPLDTDTAVAVDEVPLDTAVAVDSPVDAVWSPEIYAGIF